MTIKKINEFAKVRRGASPRPISDPKYFGGNVGWVRIADVSNSKKYLYKTTQYVSSLGESLSVRVDKGDLIMSIAGTVGRPIIIGMPACIHDGFVHIFDFKDSDSEFLYYSLQFIEEKIKSFGQAGTQVNLNTQIVGNIGIFFPEYSEQLKIAQILSKIDQSIEKTEQLIAKYERIKTGLMQDLLTRGIDENGAIRTEGVHEFKDSPLGRIPVEWEVKKIGDLGNWKGGKTPRKSNQKYWNNGNKLWYSSKDIEGSIVSDSFYKITEDAILETNQNIFPALDSLIFVFRSGILRHTFPIVRSTKPFSVNQDLKVLVPYKEYVPYFLFQKFKSLEKYFLKIAVKVGTTVESVDVNVFFNFEIALPKLEEQRQILLILDNLDTQKDFLNSELNKFQHLKTALMQDLLTGKVRVIKL